MRSLEVSFEIGLRRGGVAYRIEVMPTRSFSS